MKQVEKNVSGIFLVENEAEKLKESPGGYFIEKSRKTELYRIKQKEEIEETKKKSSWFEKIRNWFE